MDTRKRQVDYKEFFDQKMPADLKKRRVSVQEVRTLSEDEYAVRAIVAKREKKSGLEYLVRWAGYPGWLTWEPAAAVGEACKLLIQDLEATTPQIAEPSEDLTAFNLDHMAFALQQGVKKEDDQTIFLPFSESVYRTVFGEMPKVDGWSLISEEKLEEVFKRAIEWRYAKTPTEGRKFGFPIRMKAAIKATKPGVYAEFAVIQLRKNSANFE